MADESDPRPALTSFAERLNYLFDTVHPADRKPYTNPEAAAAITEAGEQISGQYLWLLRRGDRDNPGLRHIEAIARFFGVPGSYFLNDEVAVELTEQLEFLKAVRDSQVREISMRGARLSPTDRASMLRIMRSLEGSPDDQTAAEETDPNS